jgi:hypothetical protein
VINALCLARMYVKLSGHFCAIVRHSGNLAWQKRVIAAQKRSKSTQKGILSYILIYGAH